MARLGVVDESLNYRCDTPIRFKITDYNFRPIKTSDTHIRLFELESYRNLWGAVYPMELMGWNKRKKIKTWVLACKDIDYTQYALQRGQLCPCDICGKENRVSDSV